MKKLPIAKIILFIVPWLFWGCTNSDFIYYQRAQQHAHSERYAEALDLLDKLIKKSIQTPVGVKAAREAAKISFYQTKNYNLARQYYKLLVTYSPDPRERIEAQKQIASICFDHLNLYSESVIEYSRLLQMDEGFIKEFEYRIRIAKSYFFQNNFAQALSEVDELLQKKPKDEYLFPLMLLKANILTSYKKMDDSVRILSQLLERFPRESLQENIHLVLSLAYEEKKDFREAIQILEKYKDQAKDKDFVVTRLERLKQRLLNAPGAQGLRK